MARRVLLADDSVTAQNMGRRILADAGYDVITVNNGSAALKKVAEQKPDLIVLDVYMPGYGGLEVCQRLKENYETACIPILLSVGKLEPFKADEAKKVQADAFIVKPFEASELLTALAKLEDKIKPQASSQKHGRFGKTLEPGERFGDKETGWKYRLIIPALADNALQQDGQLEKTNTEAVQQTELKPTEPAKDVKPAEPARELQTAIPSSLPKDITPEEIAALTAAAAAFSGHKEATKVEVLPQVEEQQAPAIAQAEPVTDQPAAEIPSATLAAASNPQTLPEPVAEIDTPAPQPEVAPETQPTPEAPAAELETIQPVPTETPAHADERHEDTLEVGKWGRDADVLAALATLLPTSHAAQANGASATPSYVEEIPASIAAVTSSAAAGQAEHIGPRWMAESVPVMEEEATLLLELEMEKAFAAFAAAEAARMNAAVEAPVAISEIHSTVEVSAPLPEAEAFINAATAEPAIPATVAMCSETAATGEIEEVAYAAAAAASSVTEAIAPIDVSSATAPAAVASSAAAPAAEEEVERQTEAALAAAWQNWKQIRENIIGSNIIGSELTSQIAGVAAAELKSSEQRTAVVSEEAEEADAESADADLETSDGEDPAAIASIVDSVLAELKPKLVAEIARKMKQQEKKGKQKKGKK